VGARRSPATKVYNAAADKLRHIYLKGVKSTDPRKTSEVKIPGAADAFDKLMASRPGSATTVFAFQATPVMSFGVLNPKGIKLRGRIVAYRGITY